MDALSGCLHTISGARIERGESSGDEGVDSATRDDGAGGKEEDAVFELLRTISGTRLEKVDNSDGGDMIVRSNVGVGVVNLTEW